MQNSGKPNSESNHEHAFQHIVSFDCSVSDFPRLGELTEPEQESLTADSAIGNPTSIVADKSDQRIYRIDNGPNKFQPSRLLAEPQLHVSVKSNPAAKAVDIEKIVQHKKAVRISQGAELQEIVVSPYETIDTSELNDPPSGSGFADQNIGFDVYSSQDTVAPTTPIVTETSVKMEQENPYPSRETKATSDSKSIDQNVPSEAEPEKIFELKPAWAVKSFRWPETIVRLCTHHKSAFEKLVESLHLNVNRGTSRIGVIHSRAGQGSTTLATCLANVLADSQAKVLLADLDLENPDLEEVANIKLENGWQQFLEQDQSINEFLVRDSASNITLMPLRREIDLVSGRPGLLKKIKSIAVELAVHFDFSVYDIGNVRNLMIEENCHVGFLDGAVIVSDSSGSESNAVTIYEKLIAAGVPSVVIAENFRSKARSAA